MRSFYLVALVLLALAGCGGGGDEGDSGEATTQPVRCGDAPKACQ